MVQISTDERNSSDSGAYFCSTGSALCCIYFDLSGTGVWEDKETRGFEENLQSASHTILNQIDLQKNFETDGKYDANKLVDIMAYMDSQKITGEDESGIAYRLGDLSDWIDNWGTEESSGDSIIVCKKADGTYAYYM